MLQQLYLKIIRPGQNGTLTPVFLAARLLLFFLSIPYAAVTQIRSLMYRFQLLKPTRSEIPTIAVGNITAGGTGKTPVVAWIVRQLQEQGHRPGIISRGYRSDASGTNDELRVLERLCPGVPHVQNPDRIAAAREFEARGDVDVLVLDDAYQHRRIHRDLNIVLIDATCPFGHGYLLPRGLLRERGSALNRADLCLLTRTDQVASVDLEQTELSIHRWATALKGRQFRTQFTATSLLYADGSVEPLAAVSGKRAVVMAAIGNPDAFVGTCKAAQAEIVDRLFFPDHHHYLKEDLRAVSRAADDQRADLILTTLKDMVKVDEADPRLAAVMIETSFPETSDSQIVRDILKRTTMMKRND